MAYPLEGVRIKIERAKHHIRDLEAEIKAFHGRNPIESSVRLTLKPAATSSGFTSTKKCLRASAASSVI
jgi:hypothetical protein